MIKQITDNKNNIIAIITSSNGVDSTTFFTDNKCPQQVGYIVKNKDDIIQKHYHKQITKTVIDMVEILYVISGRCLIDFYDCNQTFISNVEVNKNDLIVMLSGGHGFKMLEDTVFLEVKNGPYLGVEERIRF